MNAPTLQLLFFLFLTFLFSAVGLSEYQLSSDLGLLSAKTLFNPTLIQSVIRQLAILISAFAIFFWYLHTLSKVFLAQSSRHQFYVFLLISTFCFLSLAGSIREALPQLSLSKIFIAPVYDGILLGATLLFWLAVIIALVLMVKRAQLFRASGFLVLSVIFLSPFLNGSYHPLASERVETSEEISAQVSSHNLVIIGLDSVSLAHLQENRESLPNLSTLIATGHLFSNTYTPLARTFPAWVSLLRGQYPATTGVRFNLTSPPQALLKDNLARDLQTHGFTTVFAQDERRFSNIDESYGFDLAIGPELGVSDFLMPVLSDYFMVAYLTDSVLGPWLFPGIYNNRVAPKTYRPESFSGTIANQLSHSDHPFFLAAHFCLPHFPYKWRDSDISLEEVGLHQTALVKADQQVGEVIQALKENQEWNNTIVVLMSDHGEGLGQEHNTWVDPEELNNSRVLRLLRGHGNSLFSKDQTNVILHISTPADRRKGTYTENNRLASLVDIRPTVLNLLGLSQPRPDIDGLDLFSDHDSSERIVFMETGVTAALPMPGQQSLASDTQLREWIDSYRISESGLLTIKPEYAALQIQNKQTAAMNDSHLLIRDHRPAQTQSFYIDKATGAFTSEADIDRNLHPQAARLIQALNCYETGQPGSCSPP